MIQYKLSAGWRNQKLTGFLHAGDRVRVNEVSTIACKRVWVRFNRLLKKWPL
jgi:hypothetical protein